MAIVCRRLEPRADPRDYNGWVHVRDTALPPRGRHPLPCPRRLANPPRRKRKCNTHPSDHWWRCNAPPRWPRSPSHRRSCHPRPARRRACRRARPGPRRSSQHRTRPCSPRHPRHGRPKWLRPRRKGCRVAAGGGGGLTSPPPLHGGPMPEPALSSGGGPPAPPKPSSGASAVRRRGRPLQGPSPRRTPGPNPNEEGPPHESRACLHRAA